MASIDDIERILMGKCDLSDLSEDHDIRFSQLEEQIRKLVPIVAEKQFLIETQLAVVREKEKTVLESHSIEYEYMDGPFLEPAHSVFRVLTFLTGRIVLYNVTDEDLPAIMSTLRADLRGENARLQLYFADGLKWMNPLREFRGDLAVRYADIYTITEVPDFPMAFCITAGHEPVVGTYNTNMRNGNNQCAGTDKSLGKNELMGRIDHIRETHKRHNHNTYIITHPSELLTHHQLGLLSYKILLPRWHAMHPHNLN